MHTLWCCSLLSFFPSIFHFGCCCCSTLFLVQCRLWYVFILSPCLWIVLSPPSSRSASLLSTWWMSWWRSDDEPWTWIHSSLIQAWFKLDSSQPITRYRLYYIRATVALSSRCDIDGASPVLGRKSFVYTRACVYSSRDRHRHSNEITSCFFFSLSFFLPRMLMPSQLLLCCSRWWSSSNCVTLSLSFFPRRAKE